WAGRLPRRSYTRLVLGEPDGDGIRLLPAGHDGGTQRPGPSAHSRHVDRHGVRPGAADDRVVVGRWEECRAERERGDVQGSERAELRARPRDTEVPASAGRVVGQGRVGAGAVAVAGAGLVALIRRRATEGRPGA